MNAENTMTIITVGGTILMSGVYSMGAYICVPNVGEKVIYRNPDKSKVYFTVVEVDYEYNQRTSDITVIVTEE